MKQFMMSIAVVLLLSVSANAQETKPHKNHKDSTQSVINSKKAAVVYACPMHADVTSDKSGKCPKCKMELEKRAPAQSKDAKRVYTCPMHSEVTSDKPGKCPKCKMTLVQEKKSN